MDLHFSLKAFKLFILPQKEMDLHFSLKAFKLFILLQKEMDLHFSWRHCRGCCAETLPAGGTTNYAGRFLPTWRPLYETNEHRKRYIPIQLTEIRLHIPFYDWFWTKQNSFWFQIKRIMVNVIWFQLIKQEYETQELENRCFAATKQDILDSIKFKL